MKKILLLICILFVFNSCKKCGTCYYENTITPDSPEAGYPKTTEYSEDGCGDDYKEMKKFNEDKTYRTSTVTGNPANMVIHQKYCTKK